MDNLGTLLSDKIDTFSSDQQHTMQALDRTTAHGALPNNTAYAVRDGQQTARTSVPIDEMRRSIHAMKEQLESMLRLLDAEQMTDTVEQHARSMNDNNTQGQYGQDAHTSPIRSTATGERVIEGVFNGEKMVGEDGQEYMVPPNYASKSKMVEGDMLKLIITQDGKFIYKQIAPVERKTIAGYLVKDPSTNQWGVRAYERTYRVLTASVTFYRGKPGDEVFIRVPHDLESTWGAVDQVIKR